jgi:uncharacterized LabA/DUF88 family protein
VFIDFENLALGVKEQERANFRIDLVLKRLLEKGRVVYKRAYCDWSRFRGVTRNLHAHGITMVDIPENKLSGKNSADIHMVVDALDLAHIKPHIDVFALLSGDSDFSPLVSKLKENNKRVIGLGVKNSTSNLLIDSCDEFIYYDDVVRMAQDAPKGPRRAAGKAAAAQEAAAADEDAPAAAPKAAKAPGRVAKAATATALNKDVDGQTLKERRQEALQRLAQIVRSLERDYEPVWGSMVKQAIRRVYPGFNEEYYGYSSFVALLEDAQDQDYVDLEYDERRGNYKVRLQPE